MSLEKIRNFVIISHIDHGKSTLADRLLEVTGTVEKEKMKPQYLDMLSIERERGITIKMQPVRMVYRYQGSDYILNLIDTPGHVDFSYEVSRSLAAVEGAILLVDATQGIQAQTLANLDLAKKQGLVIIPAVNKIDLPHAKVEETVKEVSRLLEVREEEVLKISAKKGINIDLLLEAIINKIPSPQGKIQSPLRALIFSSFYDPYKGVLAYVRVFDGTVRAGEKLYLVAAKESEKIKEVGFFAPEFRPIEKLSAGEIGYIATGIKDPSKVRVGDTLTLEGCNIEVLPGYQEPQPVVFASIYPVNSDEFDDLKEALQKLKLNDYALTFEPEVKPVIGRGFRCGFLGSLHAEIVAERLKRDFNLEIIISSPSVVYEIIDKKDKKHLIYSPADWLDPSQIKEVREPWVRLRVLVPSSFLGQVLQLLENLSGYQVDFKNISADKLVLEYEVPLRELIINFYDKLKGVSQGYASMEYEVVGYKKGDLVKLDVLIAGQKEEAFAKIVPKEKAYEEGKKIVSKLKEFLPAQLFEVALQAAVGGKIIARETIKAKRRDVTAPLYGGDYTRKMKLLEKQKRGKKELKEKGRVRIPPKTFFEMLKS